MNGWARTVFSSLHFTTAAPRMRILDGGRRTTPVRSQVRWPRGRKGGRAETAHHHHHLRHVVSTWPNLRPNRAQLRDAHLENTKKCGTKKRKTRRASEGERKIREISSCRKCPKWNVIRGRSEFDRGGTEGVRSPRCGARNRLGRFVFRFADVFGRAPCRRANVSQIQIRILKVPS